MPDETSSQAEPNPGLGCLLRLFWMAFGNVALLFAGMQVASSERIGAADAVYAGVVVALLVARYVDVVKLNGMTIHAEPATRAHLRRYALVIAGVGLLGWLLARFLIASSS
jgi:hypothetical protein